MKIENNYELIEIEIKNCMCYYFLVIIKIENLNFGNILLDKKIMRKCFDL